MEEKLTQIAENSVELYNRCRNYHYVATIPGDGTAYLTFKLPFTPDALQVFCTEPRLLFHEYAVAFFNADLCGLGLAAAMYQTIRENNLVNTAMTTGTVESRVQVGEDGTVTLMNITDKGTPCSFPLGFPYTVVASKYTDKTYRQRYEEFVESLTGSGTAQVCKKKVDAAFTPEEWAALIATRPDWTFMEV